MASLMGGISMKLYLNHDVMGRYHVWGRSPIDDASEEYEVNSLQILQALSRIRGACKRGISYIK